VSIYFLADAGVLCTVLKYAQRDAKQHTGWGEGRSRSGPAARSLAFKLKAQDVRPQVAQFAAFFGIAAVFMLQPLVAPGQIAAVFGTFGILYALQVLFTSCLSAHTPHANLHIHHSQADLLSCLRAVS
jgi:hypothetical protein